MPGQKQPQIDLSAGMVPAQASSSPTMDLSAGMVPASGDQSQAQPQKGVMASAVDSVKNFAGNAADTLGIPRHPIDQAVSEAKQVASQPIGQTLQQTVVDPVKGILQGPGNEWQQAADAFKRGDLNRALYHGITGLIPGLGPSIGKAGEQAASGDYSGAAGTTAGSAAQLALGKAAEVKAPPTVESSALSQFGNRTGRGLLANRMQEVPQGTDMSRAEVLDAARQRGVNLDVADATGSGVARGVKAYTERSLGGRDAMRNNVDANVGAVEDWARSELGNYDRNDFSREGLGSKIQEQLKSNYDEQKQNAAQGFKDLDERVGQNTIDGTKTVEAQAQQIISEMKDYYSKHPELKPKQAWSILENLARRPKVETTEQAPGVGFGGASTAKAVMKDAPAHNFSWSELHQLRSDLMEAYRNSPDLTKSQPEAWLQRMVKTIDDTMTNAASGLSPEDRAQFRAANDTWEGIKSTYDNPQHPFFAAVRSQFPSQVTGMLANKTPELARQVHDVLGDLKGPYQRDFVGRLLDPNGDGRFDLKNLESRVSKLPDEYLRQQLGPDGADRLKALARVSKVVTDNINTSGTSDVLVPAGEIGAAFVHPVATAAMVGNDYAMSRGLTSPGMVDRLTRPGMISSRMQSPARPVIGSIAASMARRPR